MSGEDTRWIAALFGGALILIAVLTWYASKRWPLAGVMFQLAARRWRRAWRSPGPRSNSRSST